MRLTSSCFYVHLRVTSFRKIGSLFGIDCRLSRTKRKKVKLYKELISHTKFVFNHFPLRELARGSRFIRSFSRLNRLIDEPLCLIR